MNHTRYIRPQLRSADLMITARCVQCQQFWSYTRMSPDFELPPVTSRFCPTCIGLLPVMGGIMRRAV